MPDPYRHSDEYDPEPDYDRPTRAEAEADEHDDEQWGPDYEERACFICDGLGHGYIIGWEEVEGKGMVPILSGPCPLEEPSRWNEEDVDVDPDFL